MPCRHVWHQGEYLVDMIDISSCPQQLLDNLIVTCSGSTNQSCLSILSWVSRFQLMGEYLVGMIDISSCTQKLLDNVKVTSRCSTNQSCPSFLSCMSWLQSMGEYLIRWVEISSCLDEGFDNQSETFFGSTNQRCLSILRLWVDDNSSKLHQSTPYSHLTRDICTVSRISGYPR